MKLSTKDLTWSARTRSLVAEASDLSIRAADPIPTTFEVKSHVTGKVVTFKYSRCEKDREGDLICWRFLPVEVDVCELVIYND